MSPRLPFPGGCSATRDTVSPSPPNGPANRLRPTRACSAVCCSATSASRLGRYYRTYAMYVEDEVRSALDDPAQLELGPRVYARRGTRTDDTPAFVVEDGNYVSARWPGDAYLFAKRFVALLEQHGASL